VFRRGKLFRAATGSGKTSEPRAETFLEEAPALRPPPLRVRDLDRLLPARAVMEDLEAETLEEARAGDLDAYRAFVRAYERPIHHTVFRLVGSRFAADVEDITQDVFLKLFRALPQFDPSRGTKLSSWVFTFVKNYCFDVLKRRRLPIVSLDGGIDGGTMPVAAPTRGPRDELSAREIQDAIGRAVDLLPREQKLAFVLREYEGLAYAEIAEISACSEGTIKSRIHRAKEALRFRLRRLLSDVEGELA
jgi:RNA polymerase sigma-70 factor (ECF subfamily)